MADTTLGHTPASPHDLVRAPDGMARATGESLVALLLPTKPMLCGGPARSGVLLVVALAVALGASTAEALHQNSPGAIRMSHGAPVTQPSTQSWGFQVPFASTDDLAKTGSTSRQIFVFGLFNYDCQHLVPGPALACPTVPGPVLTQETSGPGEPDNPSLNGSATLLAFDADGAFGGGTGPGVGHRQIFLKNRTTGQISRITDAPGGESVRPSVSQPGGMIVFESTAPLLGGSTGISQIFLYQVSTGVLTPVTNGAGPSTLPRFRKLSRILAFESTADLLGNGHDTGVSQIFWYDRGSGQLHQLTRGNGASHHPYVTSHARLAPGLGAAGRGPAIFFDSAAHDLPGTSGGPGTQIYLGTTGLGDLPPITQLMPHAVAGCSPSSPGDTSYPSSDPSASHLAFLGTGDLLCNGTIGSRLFVLDLRASPTRLLQITGRGDVQGPVAASVGRWFVTLSTTDDMTGTGVCGHQLHVVDYFAGRWPAATNAGQVPSEPPAGDPAASCNDGDPCTTDSCNPTTGCEHSPITGCTPPTTSVH